MKIEKTSLPGVLRIEPKVYADRRGHFMETWNQERYAKYDIDTHFVQDNHSVSIQGTLRGLHFQKKHPQGKLVSVSYGEVFDVVVDICPKSPTYGQWHASFLSAENACQLWIPAGYAHGFLVISKTAHFHYKCTDIYRPDDEGSLRWNDPDLAIKWPLQLLKEADQAVPLISDKDAIAPFFSENKHF